MTTDLIAQYRAAAARMREMEAAGSKAPWKGGLYMPREDARLICASRNLLLPLLDAGDALAATVESDNKALAELGEIGIVCGMDMVNANRAALAALTDALERECGVAA